MNDYDGMLIQNTTVERDRLQYTEIFSENLWYLLFESCNAETLDELFHMSSYLRNLLLSKRTLILFPKVWRILISKYGPTDFFSGDTTTQRCCKPAYCRRCGKQRVKSLGTRLLAIRCVCKYWCHAFDNWCHLPCPHTVAENQRNIAEMIQIRDTVQDDLDVLVRDSITERFVEKFQSTHTNDIGSRSPFLANSLRLRYSNNLQRRSETLLFGGIQDLLSKFGHHVHHLSLEELVGLLCQNGYIQLREVLQATPHLESLDLTHISYTAADQHFARSQAHHPRYIAKTKEYVLANPIPQLKRLNSIKLGGSASLPCIIFELVQRNNHISSLCISHLSIAEHNILATPFPNLRQLSLVLYTKDDLETLEDSRLNWPLTKLTLDFGENFVYFECVNWSRLFSVLKDKWCETLTELELTLPHRKNSDECPSISAQLQLKRVERLKLKFFSYHSLDFILPLQQTLTHLSVEDLCEETWKLTEENCTIKFWSCAGKAFQFKTNLWTKFPKLGSLYHRRPGMWYSTCSRGEWLEWKERREQVQVNLKDTIWVVSLSE